MADNKLDLPPIRKTDKMTGKQKTRSISKFDLNKKTQIANVIKECSLFASLVETKKEKIN